MRSGGGGIGAGGSDTKVQSRSITAYNLTTQVGSAVPGARCS